MSTEKTATNFARFVTSVIFIVIVVAVGFYLLRGCKQENVSEDKFQQESRQQKKENWYQYESIGLIQARLVRLANNGCEAPFKECLYPDSAKWHIFDIMDRDKIPFGTAGLMSVDQLNELADMAEGRIASQKLAYLKERGIKFPSDIYLLQDICVQVYFHKRLFRDGNPTEAELKQLLPPGVTKLRQCDWKDN